jgi:hypothetical protein
MPVRVGVQVAQAPPRLEVSVVESKAEPSCRASMFSTISSRDEAVNTSNAEKSWFGLGKLKLIPFFYLLPL